MVIEYNTHKAVDLQDMMIACYRSEIQTKKWRFPFYIHLVPHCQCYECLAAPPESHRAEGALP
jgi:hypothetical protein